MSRTSLALVGAAVVAGAGLIVLDQTGHDGAVRVGTVAVVIAVALVALVAYLRSTQPDAERSARRAFARVLRGGPLPPDTSQDTAIRQLAAELRAQTSGHRWTPWLTFACGAYFVIGGMLNERPRPIVVGAAVTLMAISMRPMQRRRLARLDRLDADLDARAESTPSGSGG